MPCESEVGRIILKWHFSGALQAQNVIVSRATMCELLGLITNGRRRESYMEYGPHVARHGLLEQSEVPLLQKGQTLGNRME